MQETHDKLTEAIKVVAKEVARRASPDRHVVETALGLAASTLRDLVQAREIIGRELAAAEDAQENGFGPAEDLADVANDDELWRLRGLANRLAAHAIASKLEALADDHDHCELLTSCWTPPDPEEVARLVSEECDRLEIRVDGTVGENTVFAATWIEAG